MNFNMQHPTAIEIVNSLNRYIIGQDNAKKAIAIAMRNRWRRQCIISKIKNEVMPKNIILIGPTGSGKTEMVKRIAHLSKSPFIKIEATKFTEVGYVGRDVDSMIRDLVAISVKICTDKALKNMEKQTKKMAEEELLNILLPINSSIKNSNDIEKDNVNNSSREKLRKMLLEGLLDNKEVTIEVQPKASMPILPMSNNTGMEDLTGELQNIMQNTMSFFQKKKKQKVLIKDAINIIAENEAQKLINKEQINREAIVFAEQTGIIFIDEIDKIVGKKFNNSPEISREGVQRDILPILEGSTVQTKYGLVRTDHILFIAAGAFSTTDPSDLIPELQGRFPVQVKLLELRENDFIKILTEPENSLVKQYQALLHVDNLNLIFKESGIQALAKAAAYINVEVENIGARRLYTVMETLLEKENFEAPYALSEEKIIIVDKEFVNNRLLHIVNNKNIKKYIL